MLINKIRKLASYIMLGIGFSLMVGCATSPSKYHTDYQRVPYRYFAQTGYASFYGHHDGFNGQRMANGFKFQSNNPHVAAHPSLPLGTKLKVTDLRNNKVLYVEVTDRMGHVRNRIIDLSYAAAKYFKMQGSGVAKVRIVTVTEQDYKKHIK